MLKKIVWLLRGFLALLDFRKWGVFQEIFQETRFNAAISPSWSQAGEDISIAPFLSDAKLDKFYIDVGAHDPNRFSVTRKLYTQGWSGIDVDGNPTYEAKFRKLRPRNLFINACIGSLKSYEFTIFTEGAISTANKNWVDKFQSEGAEVKEVVKIPGMTLRELINLPKVPETVGFINIDIEGADEDALRSLELETLPIKRFPKWLLLETTPPVQGALMFPAVQYAVSHGYIPWLVLPMATLLKAPEIEG
jgi:FkbM family methyltransferase